MTPEPVPILPALRRASATDGEDARLADDRRAVLLEVVENVLGEHAGKPTITVDEFAQVFGIGRSTAFEAVRRGDVPSIKLGRRVVVPVPALTAQLLGVNATNADPAGRRSPTSASAVPDAVVAE
jgi:excisionase family DNA binding protein